MKLPRVRLSVRWLMVAVVAAAVALWAWTSFWDPAVRWRRLIRDDNESNARWHAARRGLSGEIPGITPAEAVEALCRALGDPSFRVRETAAVNLRAVKGADAEAAVPHLIDALDDPNRMVRLGGTSSLGIARDLGEPTKGRVESALVRALADPHDDVRIAAGLNLALMGRGEPAIPALTELVHAGRDPQGTAAFALGFSGSRDEAAIRALREAAVNLERFRRADPRIKAAVKAALDRAAMRQDPHGP